ncbi:hypothetical protein HZB93_00065 [Candidatus Falkowbacteria bacterium]|nr:hypothetical protein [Candidatus Falkowbacteria bacterium]
MNWKKAIGFGAIIWALMFVIVSAFIGFKVQESLWLSIGFAIIAGVLSFIFAGYVKPKNYGLALGYGFSWLVVGVILDVIVTMRFNPAIFGDWTLWLGYGLGVLAPLLRVKKASVMPQTQA